MNAARPILIALLACTLFFTSSFNYVPETDYSPVLMTRTDLEQSIELLDPRPIQQIGKIYKKDTWIYITEKFKGIHLIDNTNPASPVKAGFIRVPGCIDISVKNNSLYADNSVDLITIDMSALPEISVTSRVRNIFPEFLPPDLHFIPSKFSTGGRPENTVIIEWKKIR